MSKTKRILCLIAIMCTSFAVMADLVVIPVISDLYGAFPDSPDGVNYIISGPQLIVVVVSLLTTFLMRKVNKKVLLVVGGIIFAVGAIAGALVPDVVYVAIMRTLVGVGMAVLNVVAVSMIADLYDDDVTRAKITGYYNAALSLVGMINSFAGGWLGASGWANAWNAYWVAIPMVIMLVLFIPSIRPDEEDAAASKAQKGPREPLGSRYWIMSVSWLVLNIAFGATVLYYVSPYVVENGLGDSVFAGTINSVKSVVGLLVALAFGVIYSKLRRNTNLVACLIAGVGLILLVFIPNGIFALVMITVVGCCYKVCFSYAYAHGFEIVPPSRTDDATAITTAVYGLGSFLSTYIATWIAGAMSATGAYTPTWIVFGIVFFALAVVEFITARTEKGMQAE